MFHNEPAVKTRCIGPSSRLANRIYYSMISPDRPYPEWRGWNRNGASIPDGQSCVAGSPSAAHVTKVFTAFGKLGVRAEDVATGTLRRFLEIDVRIDCEGHDNYLVQLAASFTASRAFMRFLCDALKSACVFSRRRARSARCPSTPPGHRRGSHPSAPDWRCSCGRHANWPAR